MNIRIIGNESTLVQYVKSDYFAYVMVLITFALGILAGVIYYNSKGNEEQTTQYLEEAVSQIQDITSNDMMQESLIKNVGIAVIFWILGASVIGIPFLLLYVAYKGVSLGFTISSFLIAYGIVKGNITAFTLFFFQNTLLLVAMSVAIASSIRLAINLVIRKKDMKMELVRHTIICILSLGVFMASSMVELMFKGPIFRRILEEIK